MIICIVHPLDVGVGDNNVWKKLQIHQSTRQPLWQLECRNCHALLLVWSDLARTLGRCINNAIGSLLC